MRVKSVFCAALLGVLFGSMLSGVQAKESAGKTFEAFKKSAKNPVARIKEVAAAPKVDGDIDAAYKKNAEALKLVFLGSNENVRASGPGRVG